MREDVDGLVEVENGDGVCLELVVEVVVVLELELELVVVVVTAVVNGVCFSQNTQNVFSSNVHWAILAHGI